MQGRIFIDRSGVLFEEVLSLLRNGSEWRPPKEMCVMLAYLLGLGGGLTPSTSNPSLSVPQGPPSYSHQDLINNLIKILIK